MKWIVCLNPHDLEPHHDIDIGNTIEISAKIFLGIIGASMGLFEIGFRIFISATVFSESAVDLVHLISQTEVSTYFLKQSCIRFWKFFEKMYKLVFDLHDF